MLVLIGASLAHRGILKLSWPVLYTSIVRLIILPVMIIPLLRWLPLPEDVCSIAVIVALMPSAVSSVIMTRRYGGNPDYAASTALVTTLCSIVTVPLAVWFLF
jgi:predicted permease